MAKNPVYPARKPIRIPKDLTVPIFPNRSISYKNYKKYRVLFRTSRNYRHFCEQQNVEKVFSLRLIFRFLDKQIIIIGRKSYYKTIHEVREFLGVFFFSFLGPGPIDSLKS
jgi:hypothetical protein